MNLLKTFDWKIRCTLYLTIGIAVLMVFTGCRRRGIDSIVIRGSDTEVNLALRLAETYMDHDPDVSIAVTGGGSGTGIAALLNKRTDIANSSREFKPVELEMARERGIELVPIIFAVDALCFIVNENFPLDELTIEQVKGLFTGKIENWKEIGGPDKKVSLYGRQGNSGTFTFIQKKILEADYSLNMKQMNGNSQIVEGVRNDVAGIGYTGIGYAVHTGGKVTDGIKVLAIQTDDQDSPVSPVDPQNIANGSYRIVRPLYQYMDGRPEGKLKEFLLYELSEKGQSIVSENGYFPISEIHVSHNNKYLNNE